MTDITVEERDALHEQVLTDLSGIDDLRMAYQAEDFEKAERLGIEFGDELRLMQDLGWGYAPAGKAITLTMPPEQLHRLFSRLRSAAEDMRADEEREEAEVENEARAFQERARRVTPAWQNGLYALDRNPRPRARPARP